jgi:hypothetical protein
MYWKIYSNFISDYYFKNVLEVEISSLQKEHNGKQKPSHYVGGDRCAFVDQSCSAASPFEGLRCDYFGITIATRREQNTNTNYYTVFANKGASCA